MIISDKFSCFCSALKMNADVISSISCRAKEITRRVNLEFRGIDSDIRHSLFIGSYGRGTNIEFGNINMLIEMPSSFYEKYDNCTLDSRSSLFNPLYVCIRKTFPEARVSVDDQGLNLNFDDGISYEIIHGFVNKDGESYTCPVAGNGSMLSEINPKAEIRAINTLNNQCNKNLKRLCRMTRAWKHKWNVPISGLLIDTLAYNFMTHWEYRDKPYEYYAWQARDFFEYLKNQENNKSYWLAPGSRQYVRRKGPFEYKALQCYNLSLEALIYEAENMPYKANETWREIFGTKFPLKYIYNRFW